MGMLCLRADDKDGDLEFPPAIFTVEFMEYEVRERKEALAGQIENGVTVARAKRILEEHQVLSDMLKEADRARASAKGKA